MSQISGPRDGAGRHPVLDRHLPGSYTLIPASTSSCFESSAEGFLLSFLNAVAGIELFWRPKRMKRTGIVSPCSASRCSAPEHSLNEHSSPQSAPESSCQSGCLWERARAGVVLLSVRAFETRWSSYRRLTSDGQSVVRARCWCWFPHNGRILRSRVLRAKRRSSALNPSEALGCRWPRHGVLDRLRSGAGTIILIWADLG